MLAILLLPCELGGFRKANRMLAMGRLLSGLASGNEWLRLSEN